MVFGYLFLEVFLEHLLVLSEQGVQVHLDHSAGAILQNLLHSLQRARGVGTVFAYFLQVAFQHVEHIYRVFVVLGVHVVLLVFYIGFDILDQSLREFGKVVDVVQRIQYAVNQSLGKLGNGSHLLQLDDFCSTLFNQIFQAVFLSLQLVQAILYQEIDNTTQQNDIEQNHIPP